MKVNRTAHGLLAFVTAAALLPGESVAKVPSSPPATLALAGATSRYADVADLAVEAPVVAHVRVRSVTPLDAARYPASRPGDTRVYVEADTLSLIRGETGLANRISFVADAPPEAGPEPKWKKMEMLLFARASKRVDQVQLLDRRALLPWSPARDSLVRSIVAELLAANAPPAVTSIESAFHVAGTITGEGETQLFLATANGKPVSLSIVRRPGLAPLFGVSLGEVLDEAAALPARDTLLWYRLACSLPGQLPLYAVRDLAQEDAAAARSDYGAFMTALGRCTRSPQ